MEETEERIVIENGSYSAKAGIGGEQEPMCLHLNGKNEVFSKGTVLNYEKMETVYFLVIFVFPTTNSRSGVGNVMRKFNFGY